MICNLCLENFLQCFNKLDSDSIRILRGIVKELFKIKILPEDDNNVQICDNCQEKLLVFHTFYQMVLQNHKSYVLNDFIEVDLNFESFNPDLENQNFSNDMDDFTMSTIEYNGQIEEELSNKSVETCNTQDVNDIIKDDSENSYTEVDNKKLKLLKQNEMIHQFFNLTCHQCNPEIEYNNFSDFVEHLKDVHQVTPPGVRCSLCNKKIRDRFSAVEHVEYHSNPEAFKCFICTKRFTQNTLLKLHLSKDHNLNDRYRYTCDVCHEPFKYSSLLKRHKEISHPETINKTIKIYYCDLCPGRLFHSKRNLRYHMQLHIEKSGFICDICSKCFTAKHNLQVHYNTVHATDAKILIQKCPICGKVFKNKHSLSNHINVVHAKRDFICDICEQLCKSKAVLIEHVKRVHLQIKGYRCSKCKALFKNERRLKEHLNVHKNAFTYDCLFCEKQFKSSAQFYTHRKKQHPLEWAESKGIEVFNIVTKDY